MLVFIIQLFIKSRFLIKIFSEKFHFADDVQSCMKRSNNKKNELWKLLISIPPRNKKKDKRTKKKLYKLAIVVNYKPFIADA